MDQHRDDQINIHIENNDGLYHDDNNKKRRSISNSSLMEVVELLNVQDATTNEMAYLNNDNLANMEIEKARVFNAYYQEQYFSGMSPVPSHVSFSGSNSINDDDDDNHDDNHDDNNHNGFDVTHKSHNKRQLHRQSKHVKDHHVKYKKITCKEIENEIEKYYNIDDDNNKYYTEIDILSTYVKGQKHLFIKSNYYTQFKLNFLTILMFLMTSFVMTVTPFMCVLEWSEMTVSAMHASVLLIISLINLLKLESSAEKYLQLSSFYDGLDTSLEFTNSKLLFMKDDDEKHKLTEKRIKHIEKMMIENKNNNSILIPHEIKGLFPVICNINIMSFIKKNELYKKRVIKKLRDVKNEISYILYKWKTYNYSSDEENTKMDKIKEEKRLQHLYSVRNKLRDEIGEFRAIYEFLDDMFTKEIKNADKYSFFFTFVFFLWKTTQPINETIKCNHNNPNVIKHFTTIGLVD